MHVVEGSHKRSWKYDGKYTVFDNYSNDDISLVNIQIGQVFICHQCLVHAGGESNSTTFNKEREDTFLAGFPGHVTHLSLHAYVKFVDANHLCLENRGQEKDPGTIFVKFRDSENKL